MTTWRRLALLGALLSAGHLTAAQGAVETFRVDPDRSIPRLSVAYFGYSVPLAQFRRTTGRIVLDRASRNASVDVQIDVDSLDTGYPVIDRLLQGEPFLDARRYPKAAFRSSRVHFVGARPVRIDGVLSLKGISLPVSLTVTAFRQFGPPQRKTDALGVSATSTVRRSTFGLGGLVPDIGDEIRVDVAIEMTRE